MSKERYRHYLIVRRHDGVRVGFLCPNSDLEQWKDSIEWGTVETSFRIAFTDDSEDDKVRRRACRKLYDELDNFAASAEAGGDLLHAVEQMIGMAFQAGLDYRAESLDPRPDREIPFTD